MSGSYKIGLGILGEMLASARLSTLYPKRRGYSVKHTDFKHYNFGVGLDVKVQDRNKRALVDVEVKNWKYYNKPYGTQVAKSEILDRFAHSTAQIKLLFITYLSLLTKDALRLIRSHGIHIVELGDLVTKQTFTSLFSSALKQLKQVLFGARAVSHHKLTEYLNNSNSSIDTTELHDTDIGLDYENIRENSMLGFYMRALVWFCERIGKQRAQIKHVAKQND